METIDAYSLPLGFGFHPTDVELISHYLKRKIFGLKIELEVIPQVDIYKYEPWDLPAKCHVPTRDNKWHFFSSRDRKYQNGSRTNRATEAGYWKSTGKDRNIKMHNRVIGTKKTLVFHHGRPPCGKRTDWIMHEYYMDDNECKAAPGAKDMLVLCRVTKRNGFTYDDENAFLKTEEISTYPKPPKDVTLSVVLEESSPSEEVDDFGAWLTELYDPDFCVIPAVSEVNSELKEDINYLALKQEPVDFLPKISENLPLLQSEDDISNVMQFNVPDLYSGAFGQFNIAANDPAYSPWVDEGSTLDDLASSIGPEGGSVGNGENFFVTGNDSRSLLIDPIASTEPNSNIDTGIMRRQGRAKPRGSNSRIRLQKIELKSGGSVENRNVKFADQDLTMSFTHVDEHIPQGSSFVSYSKVSQSQNIMISHEPSTLQKKRTSALQETGRSPSTHPHHKSCLQESVRCLALFFRRCLSASMRHLFVGACIMATAALILCFLLRDDPSFLGNFSVFGVLCRNQNIEL